MTNQVCMETIDARCFCLERVNGLVHMLSEDATLRCIHGWLHALELVSKLAVQLFLVQELARVLLEEML